MRLAAVASIWFVFLSYHYYNAKVKATLSEGDCETKKGCKAFLSDSVIQSPEKTGSNNTVFVLQNNLYSRVFISFSLALAKGQAMFLCIGNNSGSTDWHSVFLIDYIIGSYILFLLPKLCQSLGNTEHKHFYK